MTILQSIKNIISGKFPQLETNLENNGRNRAAVRFLKGLGYSDVSIRKALFVLNGVTVSGLGNREVSARTLYHARDGDRGNRAAQEILAGSLGLDREELFPPAA